MADGRARDPAQRRAPASQRDGSARTRASGSASSVTHRPTRGCTRRPRRSARSPRRARPPPAHRCRVARKGGGSPIARRRLPLLQRALLWTKDPRARSRLRRPVRRVLAVAAGAAVRAPLAEARRQAGRALPRPLVRRSRVALAVTVLAAVLLAGGAVDLRLERGKAYPGVRVGRSTRRQDCRRADRADGATYATRLARAPPPCTRTTSRNPGRRRNRRGAGRRARRAARRGRGAGGQAAWTADAATLEARVPAAEHWSPRRSRWGARRAACSRVSRRSSAAGPSRCGPSTTTGALESSPPTSTRPSATRAWTYGMSRDDGEAP